MDLERALKSLSDHLQNGGLLLFDGGTKDKANQMAKKEFRYESKSHNLVWKNSSGGEGKLNVELYITRKGDDEYSDEKFLEEFQLCGYDSAEIEKAVKNTDLKLEFLTNEPLVKVGSLFVVVESLSHGKYFTTQNITAKVGGEFFRSIHTDTIRVITCLLSAKRKHREGSSAFFVKRQEVLI